MANRTPQDTIKDIIEYLLFHEYEISNSINDFEDLRLPFIELTGREPAMKSLEEARVLNG